MSTQKELSAAEKLNEKRRANYYANWEHIRARDNANARKNRKENPERYRKYTNDFKKRASMSERKLPKLDTLADNPDAEKILLCIRMEMSMVQRKEGVSMDA